MTSLNPSLRLALFNKTKRETNLIQKGFTLIELMVVVAIVGILSAAALPQFLGTKDRAEAGALVGTMMGFAKECATGKILETSKITIDQMTNAGITMTGDCSGSGDATFANAEAVSDVAGLVCGRAASGTAEDGSTIAGGAESEATGTSTTCTLTVTEDGAITGEWT